MVLDLDIIKLFKEIIEIPGWIETNWRFLETLNISGSGTDRGAVSGVLQGREK